MREKFDSQAYVVNEQIEYCLVEVPLICFKQRKFAKT